MKETQVVLGVLSVLVLSACGDMRSIKPSTGEFDAFRGQPLTVVTHPTPDFTLVTHGDALMGSLTGGLIKAAATEAAGNRFICENQVNDPAIAISTALAPSLEKDLHPGPMTTVNNWHGSSSQKDIQELGVKSGIILDVTTTEWKLNYFSLDWTHYRVTYYGCVQVIDASSGHVQSQIPCFYQSSDDRTPPPTYDAFRSNQAAWVKQKLADATASCVECVRSTLVAFK